MSYIVLEDNDFKEVLTMSTALASIEAALRAHGSGKLVAPARFRVESGRGGLVFTAGVAEEESIIGFRVYDTIQHSYTHNVQLTAVFDSSNGRLLGVIIGNLIGPLRTGAIGGIAIKYLAREDAAVLGILGTGVQARTQVEAALQVRQFKKVQVFSPTPQKRLQFASEIGQQSGVPIEAVETAEQAVRGADVLICATTSREPVFQSEWLAPGVHINTIGPKFQHEHEVDLDILARCAVIATDSLDQIDHYEKPFFVASTPYRAAMLELGAIVAGQAKGRSTPEDSTLFCSVGLAGTEVVVANAAIEAFRRRSGTASAKSSASEN